MTTLVVPSLDEKPWPTLGPQVCAFIETNLVFGPGDLRGLPAKLDDEKRALIYRAYEVYEQGTEKEGRRRFRRVCFSLRKGTAKTELMAWIAAVELHHAGPVRCDGFRDGQPVGRPVTDPYIPLVAYTEEQTEELAYHALFTVISEGPLANDFDLGLERIMRAKGDGKAVALAAAPNARDGALTTFEGFDEVHHWTSSRLKKAHSTMLANLPKRFQSDAWALETTTAFAIGENSVAEDTMGYARQIEEGKIKDPSLFYFHRQASDDLDITTPEGLHTAVLEASGPTAEWSDIEGIEAQFQDPTADLALLERLWLNRPIAGGGRAFPAQRWAKLDI
ncbi:MAG: terminase, partial [Chloroflexi bacterium]|nr:terminase [Chloroflexota bacterium]